MIANAVAWLVDLSVRNRRWMILGGLLLAIVTAAFAVTRFSITTDIETLISTDIPWRERQAEQLKTFPRGGVLVIVEAPTPEDAQQATGALAADLKTQPTMFRSVLQPDGGAFFERNGLLFTPTENVGAWAKGLEDGRPLLGVLAEDPSLRGAARALGYIAQGVQSGDVTLDRLAGPLGKIDATLSETLAGKVPDFSLQMMAAGGDGAGPRLRNFIQVDPVLDFAALEPGRAATNAILASAEKLKLAETYGAKIRLTGQVPLNDDQFAVVQHSAVQDTLIAAVSVLVVLFLALRSWRVIVPVFFSLLVGLSATAALGLLMVGSFNLISIAFFVLFVGLGVDFGIQFSVRYRSERFKRDNLLVALHNSALRAGTPLALAAVATAVGFFSFLPTTYRGLSELGLIAGVGMLVAFLASITLVPAMLAVMDPPPEPDDVGFPFLAPIDEFLLRHRWPVIFATFAVVAAGIPLLFQLQFDRDPINLQAQDAPAVVAYRELQKDPSMGVVTAALIAPNLEAARQEAARVSKLPEVLSTRSIDLLIPPDQPAKIALIRQAAEKVLPSLNPATVQPAPTVAESAQELRDTADQFEIAANISTGPSAEMAKGLVDKLRKVAADEAAVGRLSTGVVPPLQFDLAVLKSSLDPQEITVETLPEDMRRQWLAPDGRALLEILPKGDMTNPEEAAKFAEAVMAAEPNATGAAISSYESGKTVVQAFIHAGIVALIAVAVLLLVVLRRFSDVALTLIPLILAGMVTLQIAVLSGLKLNYANIIALPLLLGVGVAFKVYYTLAWRAGGTRLLESPLTRAVFFSAATVAAAFGSMWASTYPGLSSMGELMFLSLVCTMAFAVLFQPVLMGPPRHHDGKEPVEY